MKNKMEEKMENQETKTNRHRAQIKMIGELSLEMDFNVELLSEDWIITISKAGKTHYIYGYDWGINPASAQLLAKDKTASYQIMDVNNIKAIEHKLFFNYNMQAAYTGQNGCWEDIVNYADTHKRGNEYNLICKPNKGTGGNDVYKISSRLDLEAAVQKMFSKYSDLCLCPFYNIENEYRLFFLDNEILLVFLKERPYIIGNGKDGLMTLILNKYGEKGIPYLENLDGRGEEIIPKDEIFTVSWKHNLGSGARAVIEEDTKTINELSILAKRAADILGIKFASIDVALVDGELYIMEINSGIMLENFSRQPKDNMYDYYELAKDIYRKALNYLFKMS